MLGIVVALVCNLPYAVRVLIGIVITVLLVWAAVKLTELHSKPKATESSGGPEQSHTQTQKLHRAIGKAMAIGAVLVASLAWGPSLIRSVSSTPSIPGTGGSAKVKGKDSIAIGGPAGESGIGPGGSGGNAEVEGDHSLAVGGQGGGSPHADGRGGTGGKSGAEVFYGDKIPEYLRGYGQGGNGTNTLEYNQRVKVVENLREKYIKQRPSTPTSVWAGKDSVPLGWINQQLKGMGAAWRVRVNKDEYEFFTEN